VEKNTDSNNLKVYCEKCDLILNSRQKYLKHLDSHSSTIPCDVCPIDTVVEKLINFFTRKSSQNLE
jgi:phage terminase small subunit